MSSSCSSSVSEQDLDGDFGVVPAPTFLDTESDRSDGDELSAGIDLPTLLQHVDLPLRNPLQRAPDHDDVSHMADKDVSRDLSHCGLLRTAIKQSKLLEVAHMRRRINRKVPCHSRVLGLLFENPAKVQSPERLSRCMHQGGFTEFRRWFVLQIDKPWKEAEAFARTMWKKLSIQHKYHWYVLKKTIGHVSCSVHRGPEPHRVSVVPKKNNAMQCEANMPGMQHENEDLLALGLLLTYQPALGMDDPEVGAWIRDGVRGDALRHALTTRGAHRAYFESFSSFIKWLRDKLGFVSCCACMEMGDQSSFAAQFH